MAFFLFSESIFDPEIRLRLFSKSIDDDPVRPFAMAMTLKVSFMDSLPGVALRFERLYSR